MQYKRALFTNLLSLISSAAIHSIGEKKYSSEYLPHLYLGPLTTIAMSTTPSTAVTTTTEIQPAKKKYSPGKCFTLKFSVLWENLCIMKRLAAIFNPAELVVLKYGLQQLYFERATKLTIHVVLYLKMVIKVL